MNKILLSMLLLPVVLTVTGCASVTGTPNQSVSIQTREKSGNDVVGAICELSNDEGKWFVTTPGTVTIHRSNKDLQVLCKKEGHEEGKADVISDTKASMFGNIILGGVVGAIIDHNNGSAYEYPTVLEVLMGSFTSITSRNKTQQEAATTVQIIDTPKPAEMKPTDSAVAAATQTQSVNASSPH